MVKSQNGLDLGYSMLDVIVKSWNSQINPPKVYINDNRIHHGLVGLGSTTAGFISLIASAFVEDKDTQRTLANLSGFLIGAGVRLMEDDMADANDWFNFENLNTSNNQIQNRTGYNLFG